MWICDRCGRVMDELESWREERGECFGFPAYETMWGCQCGSTDVFYLEDEIMEDDDPENKILENKILMDEIAENLIFNGKISARGRRIRRFVLG